MATAARDAPGSLPMHGKVAIVTGAGSGIGRATACAFVRCGAAVVVADIVESIGRETLDMLEDATSSFVRVDTTRSEDVERLVADCVARYGRLDYVHINAGVAGPARPVHETSEEDWDRVVDIDLKGAWLVMKHSIAAMRQQGWGSIVSTASVGARSALAGAGAYCAAKAGVVMLTRVAAIENGDRGIRVNAVAPGMVATAMTDRYVEAGADYPPPGPGPLARMAEPEEIAETVVWLCSDSASFVNGTCLTVDGGWTAAAPLRPPTSAP